MEDDSSLIGELYDEFHRDVYSFALFFTNNKLDAEDITQDTFIKVLKNMNQMREFSKKKSWILSIARNTAIDFIRKKKRISILHQMMLLHQPQVLADSNHKNIINKENWKELQLALLKLKPHYRSVIILRALHELSVKETAEILDCKETKVRVDLSRAINQLKKEISLQEGWEYDEKRRYPFS
ncbi:RNA polymerase sigma factor [Lederbergia wuyishanensis]|uniref:RNA polymerase sigma factor n=1 Tax=Lederbergia wuyishanensis TaxID=1347903 RepID=A0ABU0D9U4_9BACI|nr:RNA polymerase sigma factor [Lederbergia wuyishanensis]MCJ8007461.1 RNA polymerase sigma factor [Lederbergia wuyishanensis]MDQ0345100.1 RNA polymerase sigma-70 factor (ECF subfamily) [Lederbergia wuyishanensis]